MGFRPFLTQSLESISLRHIVSGLQNLRKSLDMTAKKHGHVLCLLPSNHHLGDPMSQDQFIKSVEKK